jgi:hypothetical protein
MENKWEVKEWGDESYALTNGTITIVTADASCEHYLQAIVDLINGSGYRFHSENNLELDQYLEIEALKEENSRLKQAQQAVWVKASEPNIKDGEYIAKYKPEGINLKQFVGMAFIKGGYVNFVCPNYSDIAWRKDHNELQRLQILDESNTSNYSAQEELHEAEIQSENLRKAYDEVGRKHAALKEKAAKMEEALRQIEKWQLPETGRFWDKEETQPMSFEACAGSNGAREYIRNVARQALEWEKEEGK